MDPIHARARNEAQIKAIQESIDALDDQIKRKNEDFKFQMQPLHEKRAEKVEELEALLAIPYGVKQGDKRQCTPALEAILREPHRQLTQREINQYHYGFIVESFNFSREKPRVTIKSLRPDAFWSIGGIYLDVVKDCPLID